MPRTQETDSASGIKATLLEKIRSREARVAVIGAGYVGLPLAVEFARAGFRVLAIELDAKKVEAINRGESYIRDVSSEDVKKLVEKKRLRAVTDFDHLAEADTISICVPTPLGKSKDPDISYIAAATEQIAQRLHRGQLVVLESTTYPGTTSEIIQPRLEESGLKVGEDIWLAFSPERVDPGNREYGVRNTPKVVGGITPECTDLAVALYNSTVRQVVAVSSAAAAEMVKLLENTFRSVNIGLVNEIAIMCDKLGIEVWEVIDAAATKPFGFMPFYPGPGLGGHCIPVDPHYLSWKLKTLNYTARFIELAGEVNSQMPEYVVGKVIHALNDFGRAVKGSKILILGVAYKRDISDIRESPALDILKLLQSRGGLIDYADPYVAELKLDGIALTAVDPTPEVVAQYDCVVITADHSCFDWERIVEAAPCIVDTRNATRAIECPEKVYKL
ncbi:MAG: nucleotide sugar dehydrogenase [Planctomycetota bacterium]